MIEIIKKGNKYFLIVPDEFEEKTNTKNLPISNELVDVGKANNGRNKKMDL